MHTEATQSYMAVLVTVRSSWWSSCLCVDVCMRFVCVCVCLRADGLQWVINTDDTILQ